MPRLATSETIPLFLVLLVLLERSGRLLFEFLLEFLLLRLGIILLHHMGTRIPLTDLLAPDILCSRLLFNI